MGWSKMYISPLFSIKTKTYILFYLLCILNILILLNFIAEMARTSLFCVDKA